MDLDVFTGVLIIVDLYCNKLNKAESNDGLWKRFYFFAQQLYAQETDISDLSVRSICLSHDNTVS